MIWLSVVTVVRDDPAGLWRSVESLRAQDLNSVEFVVVDSSADPERVQKVLGVLPQSLRTTVLREPPRGIYPAMNSALGACTGSFAYFLNAGDRLHSPHVLESVQAAMPMGAVWAHGPVEIVARDGAKVVTPDWDYERERRYAFSRGHFPPHQGTFASVDALRAAGGFDTRYRIAADYAMFLRLSLIADPVHLPFVIAEFQEGGASTLNWRQSFREFHHARHEILPMTRSQRVLEATVHAWRYALVYGHREVRPRLARRTRPHESVVQ